MAMGIGLDEVQDTGSLRRDSHVDVKDVSPLLRLEISNGGHLVLGSMVVHPGESARDRKLNQTVSQHSGAALLNLVPRMSILPAAQVNDRYQLSRPERPPVAPLSDRASRMTTHPHAKTGAPSFPATFPHRHYTLLQTALHPLMRLSFDRAPGHPPRSTSLLLVKQPVYSQNMQLSLTPLLDLLDHLQTRRLSR
jgi:hypothetical protein